MNNKLKVWIYRPDQAKINPNFLYSLNGESYYDYISRKKEQEHKIEDIKNRLKQTIRIEIPNE